MMEEFAQTYAAINAKIRDEAETSRVFNFVAKIPDAATLSHLRVNKPKTQAAALQMALGYKAAQRQQPTSTRMDIDDTTTKPTRQSRKQTAQVQEEEEEEEEEDMSINAFQGHTFSRRERGRGRGRGGFQSRGGERGRGRGCGRGRGRNSDASIMCYNCNGTGHYAKQCPSE